MKYAVIYIIAFFLLSLSPQRHEDEGIAQVDKIEGLYIFIHCKPVTDYNSIGTTTIAATWSGKFTEVRDKLIKRVKKEHPTATGAILDIQNGKAEAVTFE